MANSVGNVFAKKDKLQLAVKIKFLDGICVKNRIFKIYRSDP